MSYTRLELPKIKPSVFALRVSLMLDSHITNKEYFVPLPELDFDVYEYNKIELNIDWMVCHKVLDGVIRTDKWMPFKLMDDMLALERHISVMRKILEAKDK